jgi:Fe-S-cluster-containing hydrogenase component 2
MLSKKNVVIICDLCRGEPACVEICPEHAIQFLDLEKAANIYKSIYVEELAKKFIQGDQKNE